MADQSGDQELPELVPVSVFNDEQRKLYDLIVDHFNGYCAGKPLRQLRVNLDGSAGTGPHIIPILPFLSFIKMPSTSTYTVIPTRVGTFEQMYSTNLSTSTNSLISPQKCPSHFKTRCPGEPSKSGYEAGIPLLGPALLALDGTVSAFEKTSDFQYFSAQIWHYIGKDSDSKSAKYSMPHSAHAKVAEFNLPRAC